MSNDKQTKILNRVRALLAKADSTTFPAEAEALRQKASELMELYAIQEWQVAEDAGEKLEPEVRTFDMEWYSTSQRRDELWRLMVVVAEHCRCRLVYWAYTGQIPVVGLPSDLDYFDMLFTHLMLQMGKGLEPHPDPEKPMIENLARMKEAGMKWERIGDLLYRAGQLDVPYTRNVGVKFTRLYKDFCEETGRERVMTSPAVYRRSFAKGFVAEIARRLAPEPEAKTESTGSNELVLRDIRHAISELAFAQFGRPSAYTGRAVAKDYKVDGRAMGDGRTAGREADVVGHQNRRVAGQKAIG